MPYGVKFDLENIEERRKQRLAWADENKARMDRALVRIQERRFTYGALVAVILFIVALVLYWIVSPFAGLFVLIISVFVRIHSLLEVIIENGWIGSVNHLQGEHLAMELFDDLQELIAKHDKRKGGEDE